MTVYIYQCYFLNSRKESIDRKKYEGKLLVISASFSLYFLSSEGTESLQKLLLLTLCHLVFPFLAHITSRLQKRPQEL